MKKTTSKPQMTKRRNGRTSPISVSKNNHTRWHRCRLSKSFGSLQQQQELEASGLALGKHTTQFNECSHKRRIPVLQLQPFQHNEKRLLRSRTKPKYAANKNGMINPPQSPARRPALEGLVMIVVVLFIVCIEWCKWTIKYLNVWMLDNIFRLFF